MSITVFVCYKFCGHAEVSAAVFRTEVVDVHICSCPLIQFKLQVFAKPRLVYVRKYGIVYKAVAVNIYFSSAGLYYIVQALKQLFYSLYCTAELCLNLLSAYK